MKSFTKFTALLLAAILPSMAYSQPQAVGRLAQQGLFTTQDYLIMATAIAVLLLVIYVLGRSAISLTKVVMEKNKNLFLFVALSLLSLAAHAQANEPSRFPEWAMNTEFYLASFIFLMVLMTVYALYKVNITLINILSPAPVTVVATEKESRPGLLRRLYLRLIDSVPVAKEKDILLDHDYDGIQELDNNLPPWWKYGFYVTIIFAVVYLFIYHVTGTGKLQLAEYQEELATAEFQRQERLKVSAENINEENVTVLTDISRINSGKDNFIKLCAACHRNDGGGQVGPNLTDDYWLHGGSIKNIFRTITYGVPDKGMIRWNSQLTPKQIQELASFIVTLHGTNPAGAKEAQGEMYVPENSSQDSTDTIRRDSMAAVGKRLTMKTD